MRRCHGASERIKSFPNPPFEEERKKYETLYMPDSCSPSVYRYKVRPKANWSRRQAEDAGCSRFDAASSAKRARARGRARARALPLISRLNSQVTTSTVHPVSSNNLYMARVIAPCSCGVFSSTWPEFSSTKPAQTTWIGYDRGSTGSKLPSSTERYDSIQT
jgi:hypothetical protein